MKMIRIVVIAMIGIGCAERDPAKFIKNNEKSFFPEKHILSPTVLDNFGLVIFPIRQNYLVLNSDTNKIVTYSSYKGSSSYGDGLSEHGVINYYWRRATETDSNFNRLFTNDVLIIGNYEFIDDDFEDRDSIKPAFAILHVVDKDSDKNHIYDEEKDSKSLYLFSFTDKSLKKITPDSINIFNVEYRGFVAGAGYASGKSSSFAIYAKVTNEDQVYINNYIILFKGTVKSDTSIYMYHLKESYLENISKSFR